MKAVLFAALVGLAAFSSGLPAQSRYSVENIRFIPASYYVGDRVELRLTVRGQSASGLAPLKNLPGLAWGEFQEIRLVLREGSYEILVIFTPWETGDHPFPKLQFGDLTLEGLSASVMSLTQDDFREPSPPRGTLLLPSTRLMLALFAGLLIALPLAGAAAWLWLRPRLKRLAALYRERRPYRDLRRRLTLLRGRTAEFTSREFYIALLAAVKSYLERRGLAGCAACTTRELETALPRSIGTRADAAGLLAVFHFGDQVKFGGRQSGKAERLRDLSFISDFSAGLEKKEARRAHL